MAFKGYFHEFGGIERVMRASQSVGVSRPTVIRRLKVMGIFSLSTEETFHHYQA